MGRSATTSGKTKKSAPAISVAVQRVIDDTRVYMKKNGLTYRAMAQMCGFSSFLLRRDGGVFSDTWRASLDVLEKLEATIKTNPHPKKPKLGRPARAAPIMTRSRIKTKSGRNK